MLISPIHMVILECIKIIHSINQTSTGNPNAAVKIIVDSMKVKWYSYFDEFPHIYGIAAILDPGVKVDGLANLLTFYYELLGINYDIAYYVNKCKTILDRLCELYRAVIQPEFIHHHHQHHHHHHQFETENDFHIIQRWKNHSSKFPVLVRIAKDIFAIPTSPNASKSAFSADRRVLDKKRYRLAPKAFK
ncbi:putative AC9 transposase, partial [Bienertia sinuspersici]